MRRLMSIGMDDHGCFVAETAPTSGGVRAGGVSGCSYPGFGKVWTFAVLGKSEDFQQLREAAVLESWRSVTMVRGLVAGEAVST